MDALEAILTRRSTRKYADEIPSKELIEKVIEAGRFAPSGHDNQTSHFIVFTDKAVLDELAALVQDEFAKMEEIDELETRIAALEEARNYVSQQETEEAEQELEALECPMRPMTQILVASDELASNIVRYAYTPGTGDMTFSFSFEEESRTVVMTFEDTGVPYNPLEAEEPDVGLSAEER